MYCGSCGNQNINGEKFCKNCGTILDNRQAQVNSNIQQSINQNIKEQSVNEQYINNQQMYQNCNQQTYNQQYQNNNGNLNENYINQAVNPDMKKWAILSVVIPTVAIVWYFFIGLSFYIAIAIAGAGFSFAEKGKMADPKLAKIGKVLNVVLMIMAFAVLIMNLILAFAS